jgi:two-component system, NarL family, sensor histidine kinase BarA
MLRLIQSLFSSMSLERKCLLFFGSTLLVLMFFAFLVVEKVGRELVKNYPRNRAHDFSTHEVLRRHLQAVWSANQSLDTVSKNTLLLDELRKTLFSDEADTHIGYEILSIPDPRHFQNLPATAPVTDPKELETLRALEKDYRRSLATRLSQDRPDIDQSLDLGENEPMSQLGPGMDSRPYREADPVEGMYVYYAPIFFEPNCMECHVGERVFSLDPNADPVLLAAQYPFRAGKVTMPYKQTDKQTDWIRAIMVALGMFFLAATLFALHAIVRHLVLYPMYHLRDVSDRITRGDINQRAVIETEDEFRELAEAFNRMLRHMTETQDQLQDVNDELDTRVDELAQLNLQLYEANRLKSDFLANMSHELRTPLNSIIGFSEVLQGIESLNEKQKRYASNIQKSGRLLLEMINDILDLAKVEAGKMEVRRSQFDVSRLVHAQCDMLASLIEDKNLALEIRIEPNLPSANQDVNKLGQIINNLLSNAIKFTPQNGLITVEVNDAGGGQFEIRVTDTGVGIASEDQGVIFEKFRQSKKVLEGDGLVREFAGTGLGLSIVKELAKLLGGEVDFESEIGRGSTFWVTLPWELSERAIAA